MLWNTPKMWDGETCYILGGGTSIVSQFGIPNNVVQDVYKGKLSPKAYLPYFSPLKGKLVIGINKAYEFGDDLLDILFWGDPGFYEKYKKDILAFEGLRVTCMYGEQEIKGVKFLHKNRNKKYGLTLNDSSVISFNKNSGAAAINLAVHLGAKRIVLLGFDMNLDAKRNQHWHKFYKSDVKKVKSVFEKQLIGFDQIQKDAKEAGIEILNANQDSAIDAFEKISFKSLIVPEENFYTWKNRDQIEKICITTVFDRNYMNAGKALFKSIRNYTNCSGIDFKVITADTEVVKEFGEENCYFITEEIKAKYKDVKYSKDLTVKKYLTSWFRFEIFNMTEYDRVICIDSDCICIEDISYLFSEDLNEFDLISVEDHIVSKLFAKSVPELERVGLRFEKLIERKSKGQIDIQPALLVANNSIVNKDWYERLVKYANQAEFSYSIDEGVLNDFIHMENLKIKLLPLEWDYQDLYETHIPELRIPERPIIVHCQESKPFKKVKSSIDSRLHKWHDLWWEESKLSKVKTLVTLIIWNRFENLELWIHCWRQCNQKGAELVVIHNLEEDNVRYAKLCYENNIRYVPRANKGFDIGAFQDVCKERLEGFPNDWENLIWLTDDCIPMSKDFVDQYLSRLTEKRIPCYEISDIVKKHVRTTGFMVTKEIAKRLRFPAEPMRTREDCYQFEHKNRKALFEQITNMGKKPVMVEVQLKSSPLWDSGVRRSLNLMEKHIEVFGAVKRSIEAIGNDSILDQLAIKYKADKSSRYHNYAIKYDRLLSPYIETAVSVLEIGVAQGQSMQMWKDYFPNAIIHGGDILEASKICEKFSDRIKFHLLDQRDRAQLKDLEQHSPFDVVIDDGNHFWAEQILTFETLFPYVRSGGVYIVEDISTSYDKGFYNNAKISPIEYFKKLVDQVNFNGAKGGIPEDAPEEFGDWEKGWHRREDCQAVLPLFDSIQFYNGFIVISKR